MHIAEVVTIAKSLPLLRLNTYKSLILSYSADYRRIFRKNIHNILKAYMEDAILILLLLMRLLPHLKKETRKKAQNILLR